LEVGAITRYGEAGAKVAGMPKGMVLTVAFELDGQEFFALNGGPVFKFTEAISLIVNCETQAEQDDYWKKLSAGGMKSRCGWLKDKYGSSRKVVPRIVSEMLKDRDAAKTERVMQVIFQVDKLDVQTLKRAYES
jgi:predicted 3-demethylubiquinone-9 3-methyltransferase (glyoxalase superfamily)